MAQKNIRRVIVEMKNGRQVAGEFVDERPETIQEITVNGRKELMITGTTILIKKGFADVVAFDKSEIAHIYEASLKSQLK